MTAKGTKINRRTNGGVVLCGPEPVRPTPQPREALPIWLAALMATRCQATGLNGDRPVQWESLSGRAIYTNQGRDREFIRPLGVQLEEGDTVAVWWSSGETAYSVEIYRHSGRIM